MTTDPCIKWSGSKRSQAPSILKHFPKEMDTYYEPFCGGASVMRRLLDSDIKTKRIVCSDLNPDLINLWNVVKASPEVVAEHYAGLWTELNKDTNRTRKKEYFNSIRERYNEKRNPLDFMFIMRTTTNGMPRYNAEGKFNNSFHITRDGIKPPTLYKIVKEWSKLLNGRNVNFICCSYEMIQPTENDFVYLDPPYAGTKGMYFGGFNNEPLFRWLRDLPCGYVMSYDGVSGTDDNTYNVPEDLYDYHIYLSSGNSSFKRTIGKDKAAYVQESLYVKKGEKTEPRFKPLF